MLIGWLVGRMSRPVHVLAGSEEGLGFDRYDVGWCWLVGRTSRPVHVLAGSEEGLGFDRYDVGWCFSRLVGWLVAQVVQGMS